MPHLHGAVEADHCYRCGGTFLDAGEMGATYGESSDPARWKSEMLARPPVRANILCPAGHGYLTTYLVAWGGESVEVDACDTCRGLWLDAWEAPKLAAISQMAHGEREVLGTKPGTVLYLIQLVTMIPVEVWNPVRRTPHLVYGLCAGLPLLFGLELGLFGPDGKAPGGESFMHDFGFTPALFLAGHNFLGLVTHAFLHGSWAHLIGNLYFLWIFGDNVEDRLGKKKFILLYLVSAVAGALAHMAGNLSSNEVMVGASGAIAGLMGAYLVLFPKVKVWVVLFFFRLRIGVAWYFAIWIGLQFLMMFQKTQVAWLALVGGLAVGGALARVRTDMEQPGERGGGGRI